MQRAWPFVAVGAVLALTAWAYVRAHGLDRMPRYHPWPAIALVALAAITFGIRGDTTAMLVARIAVGAVAIVAALVWASSS